MGFCRHCGAELPEGTVFCPKCGTKVDGAASPSAQTTASANSNKTTNKEKKKGGFGKLLGIVVIAAAAVGAFLYFKDGFGGSIGSASVNVKDNTTIAVEGFDGAGSLSITIDKDSIEEQLVSKNKDMSSAALYGILDSIEVVPSEMDSLSNGQNITMKVKYNSSLADDNNVRFKETEWTYTVSDLEPTEEINPFDYVKVTFDGIAPNGTASFEAKTVTPEIGALDYQFSDNAKLRNGDQIVLSCISDADKYLKYGYKLSETQMNFTVEGLQSYVSSPSDLNDSTLNKMKKIVEDGINEYLNGFKTDSSVNNTGLKYEGTITYLAKDIASYGNKNFVILIYSTTVSGGPDNYLQATEVYFPHMFRDVIDGGNGIISYQEEKKLYDYNCFERVPIVKNTYYRNQVIYCYPDTSKLYANIVQEYSDKYDYEMSEGLDSLFK